MPDTLRPQPTELRIDGLSMGESGGPARGSGMPLELSLGARGERHAEAARAACGRAEANLGDLIRTLQRVATTVQGAAETKQEIRVEVECMHSLLLGADAAQRTLEQRLFILEQTLDRAEREATRERSFLIQEGDAFIVRLCVEHEGIVAALEQRLGRAHSELARLRDERELAQRFILGLEAQRDDAQATALQATRERDQLRSELRNSRAGSSSAKGIAPATQANVSSRGRRALSACEPPVSAPRSGALRLTSVPPDELRQALTEAPPPRGAGPKSVSSKPPPLQAPNASSTRPLSGTSLAGDAVPEKQTTPRSSGTPQR